MTYKRWLLIINDTYYPAVGDGDWVKAYETEEEANAAADELTGDFKQVVDLEVWTGPLTAKESK